MNKKKNEKIIEVESIRIGLASPECIRRWAERILPNGKMVGQVISSQTVNYKTLKPEKGGLFCERIFGPVKDFECSCGRKKNQFPVACFGTKQRVGFEENQQQFCSECLVEFTSSRVRRYRLGYIQLVSPVTHVWYLKGTPSYISLLLDMRRKKIEAITYCTETINVSENSFFDSHLMRITEPIEIVNPLEQNNFIKGTELPLKMKNQRVELNKTVLVNDSNRVTPFARAQNQETLEEIKKTKINLYKQKKPINNYYSILQNCSWEIQDDWNKFLYYMTAYPDQNETLIPRYKKRIKHEPSKIINLYGNNSSLTIPLTGAESILYFLANLDLQLLDRQIRVELFELSEEIYEFENQGFLFFSEQRRLQFLLYMRSKKIRRLKLVRRFRRTKVRPEWMVLSIIPVLPPDLRPIIQLDGDQVAVSDLNKLYQKVLFRNNRMKRHQKTNGSNKSDESKYAQRLLQESVDALIENGKGGANPICASNDRPLKSLSDMLKGKKGRFRQNLLGKRVDYSGRSVIVVGPKLKIHECGLPKEMAIELFQPFLIRRLMTKKIVRTIVSAKALIQKQDPLIWEILQQVLQNHPVLLNRAPTLHRLGIQAFQPKLVDGRAILLHPLVCTAFNADFDGDQMAVHIPLSFQARAEAWKLMWSRNNLLSPATGQPILVPSQDMVLGCYYLTTTNSKSQVGKGKYFFDLEDAIKAYNQKNISLHAPIWIQWTSLFENNTDSDYPLEIRVNLTGNVTQVYSKFQRNLDVTKKKTSQFIRTTAGRILVNQKILKNFK